MAWPLYVVAVEEPSVGGEILSLLDGLEGQARRERAELIDWLIESGFTVDEIRGSGSTPLLMPALRAMGDDHTRVSLRDVCASTGMELELLQRLQRAVGLPVIDDPDDAVLPRVDAEAVARATFFVGLGVDPDETVAMVQALMEGLDRIAAIIREAAQKALELPDGAEIELAQAAERLAVRVVPQLGPLLEDLLLLRLRNSFEMEAVTAAQRATLRLPGAIQITVAFADLAGFTKLGETLPPEELQRVASRLVELAHDVAVPPVRFVKSIGDAAMLVCADATPLLHAVLDLADAADAQGLPRLRIGVASGQALTRGGDWFGSPVNLASRVTTAARPGTVMVAESTRIAADDARFTWSRAGHRRLKGISGPVQLFRLRRATP
jgi:adenylate cyclase